ncbi:MAG: type III polyketide synthase [Myxococcota bacterium]|nr:type III polyketide synthase [Myxococcota bacterium]
MAGVGRALPPHRYEQDELVAALNALWAGKHHNLDRLARLHESVQVGGRNLALPLEAYAELTDFGKANDAFIRVGLDLGEIAVRRALESAGLEPTDVDALFFTTVTGLATPTIDARLVNRMGLRRDVRRTPMFGLGCVGGAAGVARMNDYLDGHPDSVAVLLSVELCSLTLQRGDFSMANLIASGLFGDGAAAVVGVGARRASAMSAARASAIPTLPPPRGVSRPRVLASRSVFYPDTEYIMGWDIEPSGFKVVLSTDLAPLIEANLADDIDAFLRDHELGREDIGAWIAHPGGPKVISAMEKALALDPEALALTRRSLAEIGNLSSSSVLFVLADHLEQGRVPPGSSALLMAMGPGFCAELVLLRG